MLANDSFRERYRRLILAPIAIVAVVVSGPSSVLAWTRHLSFEHGTAGKPATGANGFRSRGAFQATTYSKDFAYAGDWSAASTIRSGQRGFGSWGAILRFGEAVHETETVWLLAHFYLPEKLDTAAEPPGIQLLRINTETAGGDPAGSIAVVLDGKSRRLAVCREEAGAARPARHCSEPIGQPVALGRWIPIELQVTFAAQRGRGIVRLWQADKRVYEDRITPTLSQSFCKAKNAYILGYWPGGAPQTQTVYLDEVIVTNEQPEQRDRFRNPRLWPFDARRPPTG